jgi:outer membrane protein assembly factor BamB
MTRSSIRLRPSGRRLGGAAGALAVVLVVLISSGVVGSGARSPTLGSHSNSRADIASASVLPSVVTPKNSHYDWPEFHHDPALNAYAGNSPLSTLNASLLGVAWATNLYGAALDSPAIAYNPILRETLVYIGTDSGNFVAVNLANGQIVWGDWLGSPIRSSPLVVNGSVFVVPFSNTKMMKLNDTTGTSICSTALPGATEATPTYGAPPGGVPSVYLGTEAPSPRSGPFMAINAQTCSIEWEFSGYNGTAGSWSPASYAVNASGGAMVLFGTDDPDSSVYALNALTGQLIWRFQCYNPPGKDYDVGAGPTVSPPGANGFPQGVVYITNSADIAYAVDLNNGTLVWETNFYTLSGLPTSVEPRARSTPALESKDVIFGYNEGLINLNARNGKLLWIANDSTGTESIASPAIAGKYSHSIVITGDVGGNLDVFARIGGLRLYTYPTGGWIASSPAVSDGSVVIASSDGFLYDFALRGGNDGTLPGTSISSPADEATLANPNGNLTVYGNATDPAGVAGVAVAIQSGGASGPWWDSTTQSWSPGPFDNPATLGSPGAGSSSWSLSFPIPPAGGTYDVIANAQSISGQSDLSGAAVDFAVNYSTSGPYLRASSEYVAPGGSLTVSGGGFAPLSKVRINLSGKTLAKNTTDINGFLPPTTVGIPNSTTFGPTTLTAAGPSPGPSTSTSITIANSWDQLGYSPGHSGFEPNDPTLHKVILPGNNYWLKVAWRFTAPAPLNSSPAVVDGRAYVGDTVGNLFAIDLFNGGVLWNSTLSSGAAIDGSPAVDPTLGLVFVGANDGSLYSFYLSNGTLAWSVALGGDVSAPVLSNGVLYLTSSAGALAALAESTGAVIWSSTLGSAATAPPALNESSHLLVVGESNGAVVALNETTGAARWSYATGGPVTAAPMVTRGTVFVGSNDHRLYAFNQTTGKLRWSFLTGGAVQATPTLDNWNLLYVGSNDGYLYVLNPGNGAEQFNFSVGAPIVGLSSTVGVTVFEDSAGTIGAQKTFVEGNAGWRFPTGGGLWTVPVIIDTAVFVAAGDGSLYAFTSLGQAPV